MKLLLTTGQKLLLSDMYWAIYSPLKKKKKKGNRTILDEILLLSQRELLCFASLAVSARAGSSELHKYIYIEADYFVWQADVGYVTTATPRRGTAHPARSRSALAVHFFH